MKQVIEVFGKTVEAAISDGARQLGVDREYITYEILEMPKKGFLGFGEIPAKVRITYDSDNENNALSFIKTIIKDMDIDAEAEMSDSEDVKVIKIKGADSGVLIGHHGATLDALQYLVNLVANKKNNGGDEDAAGYDKEETEEKVSEEYNTGLKTQITDIGGKKEKGYMRVILDVEDYRAKREETLRTLARRMASKVQKYKNSVTLEPMNPYERRIIHSEIQQIPGVTTTSVGIDNERRIIIYSEDSEGINYYKKSRSRYKYQNFRGRYNKERNKSINLSAENEINDAGIEKTE
ncbi:MAG: protein jag [Clostridia bacterium]|nr:protein jag [Clostridia bacterium]